MKTLALVIVGSALLLAGCGSSDDPAATATCDQASLQSAIESILHESASTFDSLDQLECSGDWALVKATITEEAAAPRQEIFVFARSGENWILKAPEIVCGSPTADDSRPDDAEIPADLWPQACLIP